MEAYDGVNLGGSRVGYKVYVHLGVAICDMTQTKYGIKWLGLNLNGLVSKLSQLT